MGPPHISDDLLSAYLDGAVSEDERRLVEAALRSDAETAWRLNALQQTVLMLRALPQVKLPRAYSLTALLAAEQAAAAGMSSGATMESLPGAAHRPPAIPRRESAAARGQSARRGFWEALGAFFGSGNMALRNSAAAAFALFVVLLVGSQALVGTARIDSEAAPREMSTAAEMPLATAPTSVAVAAAGVQIESTPASVDEATPLVEAAPAQAASVADSARTAGEESAAQEAAPAAMMAASPGAMEEAPMAETSSAAMAAAMAAPPGMGGEGMGGGIDGGPAAVQMPGLPAEASGGGEAMTGLDVAMAESAAGVAAVASSARVAPATAAPTPAAAETAPAAQAITPSVSADSAAPVANTNADGAAASAKSAPATAMPATVAPAAQAYAASTEAAVELAPAAASASDAVSSSRAWGMSWLTAAALTAGGLALLLALLWVLSRRAPTQSTPRT